MQCSRNIYKMILNFILQTLTSVRLSRACAWVASASIQLDRLSASAAQDTGATSTTTSAET